jgi:hypothetical protein
MYREVSLLFTSLVTGLGEPPNFLFLLADDLGYNEVSWNNRDSTSISLSLYLKGLSHKINHF